MLTVTAVMTETSDIVKVTSQTETSSETKNISLEAYTEFFKNFTPSIKDTGYLPTCLIREAVSAKGTKRIYFFKELVVDISLTRMMSMSNITLKKDNPSNFTYNHTRDLLILKDFKLKNVGAIICNSNNAKFSSYRYAVGFVKVPINNIFDDNTVFEYGVFNNHYSEGYICWPSELNVQPILDNINPTVQSTFVMQYFNSIFNTDLANTLKGNLKEFQDNHGEAFFNFFTANFKYRENTKEDIDRLVKQVLQEHSCETMYVMKHIILYYIFNIAENSDYFSLINTLESTRTQRTTLGAFE